MEEQTLFYTFTFNAINIFIIPMTPSVGPMFGRSVGLSFIFQKKEHFHAPIRVLIP